jgi:3-hydroxyisobutyrate dehydrogenase-like beta-hydroxyacid dehydrogenase
MADGTKNESGIVGVGRMGLAMLKHLVKHGYQVTPATSKTNGVEGPQIGATTVGPRPRSRAPRAS